MHQCGRVTYDVLLCPESNIRPGKHRVRLLICVYFVLKIKSEIGCSNVGVVLMRSYYVQTGP